MPVISTLVMDREGSPSISNVEHPLVDILLLYSWVNSFLPQLSLTIYLVCSLLLVRVRDTLASSLDSTTRCLALSTHDSHLRYSLAWFSYLPYLLVANPPVFSPTMNPATDTTKNLWFSNGTLDPWKVSGYSSNPLTNKLRNKSLPIHKPSCAGSQSYTVSG